MDKILDVHQSERVRTIYHPYHLFFSFLHLLFCNDLLHLILCTLNFLSDGTPYPSHDDFLSRLMETGATESSSTNNCPNQMEEDRESASEKTKNILRNVVTAVDNLWHLKNGLYAAALKELPHDGKCKWKIHMVRYQF